MTLSFSKYHVNSFTSGRDKNIFKKYFGKSPEVITRLKLPVSSQVHSIFQPERGIGYNSSSQISTSFSKMIGLKCWMRTHFVRMYRLLRFRKRLIDLVKIIEKGVEQIMRSRSVLNHPKIIKEHIESFSKSMMQIITEIIQQCKLKPAH